MGLNLEHIQQDLQQVDGTLEDLIDRAVVVYFPDHVGHIYYEKSSHCKFGFLVELVLDCSCGEYIVMDHDHLFGNPW